MRSTGKLVDPTPRMVRQLEDVVWSKRDRAVRLGAAYDHGRSDLGLSIVLSDENGAIRANVGSDGMRLFVSHVPKQDCVVDVINGVVSYVGNHVESQLWTNPLGVLVPYLIDLIKPMEVAPQVHVPYGFVIDGEIVGFTFMTEVDNDPEGKERDDLGLNMDTYFVRDPRGSFDFVGEKNPANWLMGFWRAVKKGQVIDLSERIREFKPDFWAFQEGPDVWLEFDGTDGAIPAFVVKQRYRSWEPKTNNFASHQRRGEARQQNRLNGWLK